MKLFEREKEIANTIQELEHELQLEKAKMQDFLGEQDGVYFTIEDERVFSKYLKYRRGGMMKMVNAEIKCFLWTNMEMT